MLVLPARDAEEFRDSRGPKTKLATETVYEGRGKAEP